MMNISTVHPWYPPGQQKCTGFENIGFGQGFDSVWTIEADGACVSSSTY